VSFIPGSFDILHIRLEIPVEKSKRDPGQPFMVHGTLFLCNFTISLTYCTIMCIIACVGKKINLFYSIIFICKAKPEDFVDF
jgi:hypothetical protein